MKIYLNGKFVDKEKAAVSVFDHGLLYGDGVFEGIRSYDSLIFKCEEHINRLFETAKAIRLDIPLSKEELAQAIADTLKKNKLKDAYIRVIVTRGEGDLGLDPKKCHGRPAVIIIADRIVLYPQEFYTNGMEIITVKTRRNHPEALHPKLKTLNYLNNILAKIEAADEGYIEAIMLDYEGFVAECTGDNIFLVKDGKISTPNRGMLIGITRNTVLDIAKDEGIPAEERLIDLDEVYGADECFLTGTAAEIVPIVRVDGHKIGSGLPGNITKRMITLFKEETTRAGVKY